MAFQTPLTIKEAISNIHENKYLLPSIQREFVWSTEQIKMLFDSLMRDYPINSFLFWEVPQEKKPEFIFYEFLRDYHQIKASHNPKANTNLDNHITAVLDGQQRLTSLYIGLMGSYAEKMPYRRYNDPNAYPTKKLYLNLTNKPQENNYEYNFEFLSENEAMNDDENHWFLVGNILKFNKQFEINNYLIEHSLMATTAEKSMYANEALFKLNEVINSIPTISYYLEKNEELEKVLNIFIRINSGGTTLSYSDLLLSFASAQWKERDAREEITNFVDKINGIGRGFKFDKDIILKSCLVLGDFTDITFKVDNFNRTNMLKIEEEWDTIMKAVSASVRLLNSFGFNRENMSTNTIMIPIAYYLKQIGLPNNYEISSSFIEDRLKIKKWIISSLLKRVFSFAPDGVLLPIRKIINEDVNAGFPLEKIAERFKTTNRDIRFSNEDIEELLWLKYGQRDTFSVLSILYPWADLRNHFHIDHVYAKSGFTIKKLRKKNISEDKVQQYIDEVNCLGNLQLLESIPNIEKSAKDFKTWLHDIVPANEIPDYMTKHYIPNIDLELDNFLIFIPERKKLLLEALRKNLSF